MTDYISTYLIFYSIFIAIFILIYWTNYILRQKKSITKFSDKSHIFAELLMAILLLLSSTQISNYLKINQTIILFFSIGMLFYASINIIGKYIDENNYIMSFILSINIIIILSILALKYTNYI